MSGKANGKGLAKGLGKSLGKAGGKGSDKSLPKAWGKGWSKADAKNRPARQTAAMPIRWDAEGRLRVLMITSRDTGRWVMPKGWLMNGRKPWHAAEIEAMEEAGAVGAISDEPLGTYRYDKRMARGPSVPCEVTVYPMMVRKLKRRWKERAERRRRWFSPRKAAMLVDEPGLSLLLEELVRDAGRRPDIREMREAA